MAGWTDVEPVLDNMPDPVRAREKIWVPFMRNKLNVGAGTVVIGHSSGAVAAMRLAEEHAVKGLVLVSACHTDLGSKSERQAGYYSRPWQWEKIKANAGFILQYHSDDDPFIPAAEAQHVAKNLASEYHELPGQSHYFTLNSVQPMLHELRKKLAK
jgi:predicted alpha/beta hydrolase family esterase